MESKDKFERQHRRNLSAYELSIDRLYQEIIREAARIGASVGEIKPGKAFSFEDYPTIRKRVEKLMSGLKSRLTVSIVNGIDAEWTLANNKNSELARRVFGDNATKLSPAQQRRYFSTNDNARQAFQQRKVNGLNLSERVWRYADQFKEEIEMGLDLGIRNGLSAQEMTRDLRDYLRHPDKLFRRVRNEHGILHLSKRAAAYHPGRGVYRSSYMNARRLAATEANIAYRTSDHLRWQQMDFVVGMEIRLSDNHTCKGSDGKPRPFTDICDKLAGRYPKDFKFTGWHPHCRCYAISILKTQEEIAEDTRKILNGEKPDGNSVNRVDDVPQEFKDWIADNAGRIDRAKSLPYFMRDNEKYIKPLTITPQARAGADEAQAFNKEMMRAADVPKATKARTREEILAAAKERHAARTPEQIADIKRRWTSRKAEPTARTISLNEVKSEFDTMIDDEKYYTDGIASKFDFLKVKDGLQRIAEKHGITLEDFWVDINSRESFKVTVGGSRNSFTLERTFTKRDYGIEVHHDLFMLDKKLQGKGISKEVFRLYYELYKRMGVKVITVQANIDVGGYTWGRYGFSAKSLNHVLGAIGVCKDKSLISKGMELVKSWYKKHNNDYTLPFPMRLLADQPWGKDLLKGSHWEGFIDLNDADARSCFESYLGIK